MYVAVKLCVKLCLSLFGKQQTMNQMYAGDKKKLTNLQLELLKGLRHIATEKQLKEIRSLLRFYFAQQLDEAIEKEEAKRNYSADVYKSWLKQNVRVRKQDKE